MYLVERTNFLHAADDVNQLMASINGGTEQMPSANASALGICTLPFSSPTSAVELVREKI